MMDHISTNGGPRIEDLKHFYGSLNKQKSQQDNTSAFQIYLNTSLAKAESQLEGDLSFFSYTPDKLQDRITQISGDLKKRATESRQWFANSKMHFLDFMLNTAPFHLSTNVWLAAAVPSGELTDLGIAFSKVYFKEIGYGDPNSSRYHVFMNLMRSLGLYIPPFSSDAFSSWKLKVTDDYGLVDDAFYKPFIMLAAAQSAQDYRPELFGMLLRFTLENPLYFPNEASIAHFNLGAHFHRFMDLFAQGHDASCTRVLDSIRAYLEQMSVNCGAADLTLAWRRIWNGFVALAIAPDFKEALSNKWRQQESLSARQKFLEVIKEKSAISTFAHGNVSLRGRQLNDWFKNPEDFLNELEKCSHLVKPGCPDESRFLTYLVSFQGPMFQIFSNKELEVIRAWISELSPDIITADNPNALSIPVTVRSIRQVSPDVKEFTLVPNGQTQLPASTPGSHISLEFKSDGKVLTRQYSLLETSEQHTRYMIAVRLAKDSKGGSKAMHHEIHEGSVINISPPKNNFSLVPSARKYLFLAGGIGITPFLSFMEELTKRKAPFELHYGVRSKSFGPYVKELQSLIGDRLTIYDDSESQLMNIEQLLSAQLLGTHIYVCGPAGMLDKTLDIAKNLGCHPSTVHFERFSQNVEGSEFKVILAKSNKTITVAANKSILESLEGEGLSHPYSCRSGNCGTCVTRIIDGEAEHRDNCLHENDRKEGRKMTLCVSRAKGSTLVLDL